MTLSSWRGFSEQFESYAEVGASAVSDGNWRTGGGANLSYRPWPERGLAFHLEADALGYTEASPLYYSPSIDLNGGPAATWRHELLEQLAVELEAGAGYGFAREGGVTGSGFVYRVGGELAWHRGPLRRSLRASRVQSHRRSVYTANRLSAGVGVNF
jgi:hypothetical protein